MIIESTLTAEERVIGPHNTIKSPPIEASKVPNQTRHVKASKKNGRYSFIPIAPKHANRIMKRPYVAMNGPSSKMMKHGVEAYQIGDVVFAKYPETRQPGIGKITCSLGRGKYGIVFFCEQQTEYINISVQGINKTCRNVDFSEGDYVRAYFKKNNQWMKAVICEFCDQNKQRCRVKFDNLNNMFESSFYYILPEMCVGDPCFALWGKTGKFVPAVIKDNKEMCSYSIFFQDMDKEFQARPDNIIPVKSFDVDEKCLALWGRDGKFYPAVVREVVDVYTVKIQFGMLEKQFEVLNYQLRYFD